MELLEQALTAHGGIERWNKFHTLSATIRFGGLAFQSRFNQSGLLERRVDVGTKNPTVVFHDYPKRGYTGYFEPKSVLIKGPNSFEFHRDNPRLAFKSLRRSFYWDDLDLLYFAGYASWNYFNSPFLLSYKDVSCQEIEPWSHGNQYLRRLKVKFPPSIPTHCDTQTFYFDQQSKMVRLDYCPEIFARWAKAAHFCSHYLVWNGIAMPSRRVVLPNGQNDIAKPFPKLVWITTRDVVLT